MTRRLRAFAQQKGVFLAAPSLIPINQGRLPRPERLEIGKMFR